MEELGLARKVYDTDMWGLVKGREPNIASISKWQEQKNTYGCDSRECYSLDFTFAMWLYTHLKIFHQDANESVDLDEKVVDIGEKELKTVNECITLMLTELENYLTEENDETKYKCLDKAINIFAYSYRYLWW